MVVGLAFGVEVDLGRHDEDEVVGPQGASYANLLSHSSGLGLEEGDPVVPVATRRIYSNYGYDYAARVLSGSASAADWLSARVFAPLGMSSCALLERPSAGVHGSTNDLARLAAAWLAPEGLSKGTRERLAGPYLPELAGIVPGFGRFTPCPWGLGPEVRGHKQHWMGDWPPSSFGHFGKSGSLILLNADEGLGLVATTTAPFGQWAVKLWPGWTSAQRALALAR